jgi:hypothetical protein
LKETGSCQFDLPEIFFNLFYPGHYRRKIKAVRLTIPCITGPYTNVSATLRLMSSWLRTEPTLEAELREVPRSRSVSIATSTAQNDTGVFELNFRDERYMPFEGAGAISTWQLSLPKNFRQFDYQTINDVILHINYTAEEDGGLRDTVEEQIGRLDGSIRHFLTNNSLPRVFSLRQEFSNEFGRLLHNPVRHPVQIKISDKHFPFFLKGKNLRLARAVLMLRTAPEQSVDGVALAINGSPLQAFERDVSGGGDWAGLPYKVLESSIFPGGILAEHTLNVETAGLLAPESPAPADVSALDSEKLTDIYLFVEYGLT